MSRVAENASSGWLSPIKFHRGVLSSPESRSAVSSKGEYCSSYAKYICTKKLKIKPSQSYLSFLESVIAESTLHSTVIDFIISIGYKLHNPVGERNKFERIEVQNHRQEKHR